MKYETITGMAKRLASTARRLYTENHGWCREYRFGTVCIRHCEELPRVISIYDSRLGGDAQWTVVGRTHAVDMADVDIADVAFFGTLSDELTSQLVDVYLRQENVPTAHVETVAAMLLNGNDFEAALEKAKRLIATNRAGYKALGPYLEPE